MKNLEGIFTVLISILFVGYIIYNTDSNYIKLDKSQLEDYLNCPDYLELTGDTCERLKSDFEGPYPYIDSLEYKPIKPIKLKFDPSVISIDTITIR